MNSKTILIIEDEHDLLNDLKTLLEEENYNVLTANGGREGIETAKTEIPDLIICDIMMKETDGYEVLKNVSRHKATKAIPFIFLTAKVDRDDIRLGMQLGADDYLFKPYKAEELLDAIEARFKRFELLNTKVEHKEQKQAKEYAYSDKIFLKINSQPNIIAIADILYISAENQYTSLNLNSGKSFLIRKSIANWENILPGKQFIRIHRSTIINMEYIVKMGKWDKSSMLVYLQGMETPFVISKRFSYKLRKNEF